MEYIIFLWTPFIAAVVLFSVWFIKACKREDKRQWEQLFGELQDLESEERWRDSPEAGISAFCKQY